MFDFDFHPSGLAFIVMERGDQDLEKTLINQPTLPVSQQKVLWKQILNILITLHKHSIVRDFIESFSVSIFFSST